MEAKGRRVADCAGAISLEPFGGYPGGVDQLHAVGRLPTLSSGERRTGDVALGILPIVTERTPAS